jgi:cobalamin biosynthesis Mg chelatase CobN
VLLASGLLAMAAVVLMPGVAVAEAAPAVPTQDCNGLGLSLGCTPTTEVEEEPTSSTTEAVAATSTTAAARAAASTTTTAARTAASTTISTTATTVADITTSTNLLVPGDGSEGAESTTTTELIATSISDDGPSDGTLISLVIAGLVVLALAVGLLTWRYWAATRPEPLDREPPAGR